MLLHERITRIRCTPKHAPCPTCGRHGHRKCILHRRLRTLAYHRIAWLDVTYAAYQARCACRKYFRTWPLDGPPKADYDASVRQDVLDRLGRRSRSEYLEHRLHSRALNTVVIRRTSEDWDTTRIR